MLWRWGVGRTRGIGCCEGGEWDGQEALDAVEVVLVHVLLLGHDASQVRLAS